MPQIRDEVMSDQLARFPAERPLLIPFLHNFDVTWGKRRRAHNTELSIYFLAPEKTIQDQFGIETEVLLAISDYPLIQPRAMQAIDQILSDDPARGRVDQMAFFLISKDPHAKVWVGDYCAINPQARLPVVFSTSELVAGSGDAWLVRSAMVRQLFSRDLFKQQLPVVSDFFFFGRDQIVADFVSAIRQSENRGLFGLRKTGKTSLLFKARRVAEQTGSIVLYYDCKSPAIRTLHWDQFLLQIIDELWERLGRSRKKGTSTEHVTNQFREVVGVAARLGKRLAIIFDEIEWVSHIAQLDKHWHDGFVPFWQTMWTTQSELRVLSLVIAGLNPTVVEVDTVAGVQNPVFGIVSPKYITGLEEKEVRSMLHYLGKRTGMRFDAQACSYLHRRYGGHPLLIRMACSYVNATITQKNVRRPTDISEAILVSEAPERERELSFYCGHIVSELREFYRDEYHMLEMLAAGNIADFIELSGEHEYIRHLLHYGLITIVAGSAPTIAIPVLGQFINLERLRKDKNATEVYAIPVPARPNWLGNRITRIRDDLRQFEKLAMGVQLPKLYGEHGFPEAERFSTITLVTDRAEFANFINICNRCFVESVEKTGRGLGRPKYFWEEINRAYPSLWLALRRIKLYRNEELHLTLNQNVDDQLQGLLRDDLLGRPLNQLPDPYFLLQQLVIDGLFAGIQIELDRLS